MNVNVQVCLPPDNYRGHHLGNKIKINVRLIPFVSTSL